MLDFMCKWSQIALHPTHKTHSLSTRQMKRNNILHRHPAVKWYLWAVCPAWRRWCPGSSSLCSPQSDRAAALPGRCSASRPLETTPSLWACRRPLTHPHPHTNTHRDTHTHTQIHVLTVTDAHFPKKEHPLLIFSNIKIDSCVSSLWNHVWVTVQHHWLQEVKCEETLMTLKKTGRIKYYAPCCILSHLFYKFQFVHKISWMEKAKNIYFLKSKFTYGCNISNNTWNKQMLCFCYVIYTVQMCALCNSLMTSNYSNSILKVFVYRSCGWPQVVFSWLSVHVGHIRVPFGWKHG